MGTVKDKAVDVKDAVKDKAGDVKVRDGILGTWGCDCMTLISF